MSENKYIIDKDSLTGIANAIRDNQKKQSAYNHIWTASAGSVLQVIYKNYVQGSYTGSGSIDVARLFPGLSFSYLFIRDKQDVYGSKLTLKDEDGNFIVKEDSSGLATCAVVPFSTNQYIPFRVGGSSYPVNIDIFPLDQEMNHIIYDEEKHIGLSHTNIDSRMAMPQQNSLIRLQDFGSNITGKKNKIYLFNNYGSNPIDAKSTNDSKVPKMDLRYYGINKLEDIKILMIYPENYGPAALIPSLSHSRINSLLSGHQDLGYGYRPFALSKVNNYPPFYSTNTSGGFFYKNGRLYTNVLSIDKTSITVLVV